MHTLRQSAALLAAATSPAGLESIARHLGFTDPPATLDIEACNQLGLPDDLSHVSVVRGTGACRALLTVAPAHVPLRGRLTELASALQQRTSGVQWLLIAIAGDEVGVACWRDARAAPRVVALVATRRRIVASDAESLAALAAAGEGDALLAHARWCDLLGRDALSRRFYRALEQRVRALAQSLAMVPAAEAAELALLTTSRLLFLAFLQAKGWLNGERAFLMARFDDCMARGGDFHTRVLLPLYFGTLNTPWRQRAPCARAFGDVPFLNGGLFARTPLERRYPRARFSDEALGHLFGDLLDAYRFTAHEEEDRWSEVAIDPEMLGRAFESQMAARQRRVSGAFYTPQALVAHVADAALVAALGSGDADAGGDAIARALAGGALDPAAAATLRARLRGFTVLDPACGSGAFLVHVLERLTVLHQVSGDARPVAVIRREVLARAIHGVDVNPVAVWLCELRLWLSVVIESDETRMRAVVPLPNLDCNVRVGDTLAGEAFAASPAVVGPSRAMARLRDRYVRAAGAAKAPLRRAIAREERQRALAVIDRELAGMTAARRERALARRTPDLFGERRAPGAGDLAETRRLRARAAALRRERQRLAGGGALPFSFPSHFGVVHSQGGFGLVVGNPPWVRLHNIPVALRDALRSSFAVSREPGWQPSFADTPALRGFGAQVDLAALFVERSVALSAPGGTVALLVPAKLWRSLSGGSVRRLLSTRTRVGRLEDWSDAPAAFDAAVYPSVVVATRGVGNEGQAVGMAAYRHGALERWTIRSGGASLDVDPASPWLVIPEPARAAFERLRRAGSPLGGLMGSRATLGVKSGCNDAFTVAVTMADGDVLEVAHRGRCGRIERSLLRPLLRGEAVTPWAVSPDERAILWTHGRDGSPLRALPSGAARWLAPWRHRLAARSDLRGATAWWMLFRTEAADCTRPRVVWSDFGRVPRAALLPAGVDMVPLNSCYVLPFDDVGDALALMALINSPLAAAWLNVIAEPARGGWHRYLAWTLSLLPLPTDWARARAVLAPLAERAMLGTPPSARTLLDATCAAYHVSRSAMHPLLEWSG